MIRVANSDKIIDLYRDGAMVFAGIVDKNFLAWGKGNSTKINPVALVEVVYNFVVFYKLVLEDFNNKTKQINTRIDLRNMHL